MLLKDRVVLVTGGGRNVGAGIVRSLAREGAIVAINCYKSLEKAEELAKNLEADGRSVSVWQCDITDTEAVKRMIDGIVERYGRIDGVVNNASNGGQWKGWDPANWQYFVDCFEGEVKSVLNTVHSVRPYMQKQGGGRIVNIITEQWNEAFSGYHPHVTGKSAVVGLSRKLVIDLGKDNITINMVSPGWTRTERTQGRDTPDNPYIQGTPLHRMSEAEDIGDACVFFLSDLARNVSGSYLMVNGGRHPQMGG